MLFTFIPTLRSVLRRHQGLPERPSRLPMWRLLGGELLWAVRQILEAPWVLAGLVIGFVGTLVVLGASAPGPVADIPWRVLLASGIGLLLAAGGRGLSSSDPSSSDDDNGQVRPVTAATIVASVIVLVTIVSWLLVWVVTALT